METLAEIGESLRELCREHRVPGAAVALYQRGSSQTLTYGVSSAVDGKVVDARTLFLIGSDTKLFTALAALVLADRGDLDIDAPLVAYLPELELADAAATVDVTARHLLNHTAGFTGDHFREFGGGDDALAEYVRSLRETRQLAPPGSISAYSNTGYVLLGYLVSRLTSTTYEAALTSLVLTPLRLSRTGFPLGEPIAGSASGHDVVDGSVEVTPFRGERGDAPAGALWTSAADQIEWLRFLLGHGPMSHLAQRMQREGVPFGSLTIAAVGLGWFEASGYTERVFRHGGGGGGFQSMIMIAPAADFGVSVLTNSDRGHHVHAGVCRAVLERAGVSALPDPQPVDVGEDVLKSYVGRYSSGSTDVDVWVEDGKLKERSRFDWMDRELPVLTLETFGDDHVVGGDFIRDSSGDVRWLRWLNRLCARVVDG